PGNRTDNRRQTQRPKFDLVDLLPYAATPALAGRSNDTRLKIIISVLTLVTAAFVYADTLTVRGIGITDGDTLTVLVDRQSVKVRLADIDAPESKQPFGSRSKQTLSDLCFRQDARLEAQGKDRYGRAIATVYCAGRNANAEQVRQG